MFKYRQVARQKQNNVQNEQSLSLKPITAKSFFKQSTINTQTKTHHMRLQKGLEETKSKRRLQHLRNSQECIFESFKRSRKVKKQSVGSDFWIFAEVIYFNNVIRKLRQTDGINHITYNCSGQFTVTSVTFISL